MCDVCRVVMLNFCCSEKHDKTNWGHADHEEAQAGDQAAAVENQ